ncbi:ufm1-specific protease 2 isoform X1 [Pimephales promelas]|uniref:ufm1-specific protease 2 isoform X1 n=1 Tax=Pimephales promelas TaxID=90988 RepID=UPI0019557E45|nr:ufm1-specific protease 2 isoform X1 [Pimephales promelas]KAG1956605.1 ufm1-specific protease [Pimephales promelas]
MVFSEECAIIFRLKGILEFACQLDNPNAGSQSQSTISKVFQGLRSKVSSKNIVFTVCNSPILIWPNIGFRSSMESLTEASACGDILQYIESDDGGSKKTLKKKDKKRSVHTVVNLKLLFEVTDPAGNEAPSLIRVDTQQHYVKMPLPLDCVLSVTTDESLASVCTRLVETLRKQLAEMEEAVQRYRKGSSFVVPQPFHFQLPAPAGLTTVIYPAGVPDSQLQAIREDLHRKFELPSDRPYLRRANAFHFPDAAYKDGYLRNPHIHLNPPNIEDAKLYLVQGVYSYHHYMQDRVDDNGWGCAYRSLQTICSWFQQQGYVETAVPTHTQIQQALVDVGDKEPRFVGSRQWIGSIEVQVVLNQLLGVTSKILFVSQGSELATKGRELANHFQTEGTPVMIGGGVLAHTILGVAWSENSGQIRFLILDPHYTGEEDLQTITDKGWCGWKGPEFWDQNAYYNLCLPQRPKTI